MTTHRATGLERVVGVTVLSDYVIQVMFDDGVVRRIDLEPELHGTMFEPLRDPAMFAAVRVDPGAGTIVWPNGADLAPEFLYEAGEQIAP